MSSEFHTVLGLENGVKRKLIWAEGELIGDADLKSRFLKAWHSIDHQEYQRSLQGDWRLECWRSSLAKELLAGLFEEMLDLESARVSTTEELQKRADSRNAHRVGKKPHTAEDMRKEEEKLNWNEHHGPPYSWDEIKGMLSKPLDPPGDAPKDHPKCLECLLPMEWIWFSSSPWTWKHLCGRAGWTAICKKCKSWRACRVDVMN
jgi:hypothetical protein